MAENRETTTEQTKAPDFRNYWFYGIALVIILAELNLILYLRADSLNEIGDAFGITNTLFTGLAFIAFYISIRQQNIDLKYQRADINLQTKALISQQEELQEQNQTMKLQRFENTLFNMLELQRNIVENIEFIKNPHSQISLKNPRFLGKKAFYEAYLFLLNNPINQAEDIRDINEIYNRTYNQFQTKQYFQNLYQILRVIQEFNFVEGNSQENYKIRKRYADILIGQLSRYEMIWLFYHSMLEYGDGKLRPFMRKYELFEDISMYELPNPEHHGLFYKIGFKPIPDE